jgi:SOS response regulatory protein OraA/RecX
MAKAEDDSEWNLQRGLGKLLNRLSRSDVSCHEALRYLQRKGCPPDLAEKVVEVARTRGFLDDTRVAEALVGKAERQGWSQRRVRQAEFQKGVETTRPLDEEAACRQLATRWLGRGYTPDKVSARLQRRGFNYSTVRRVLQHPAAED